MKIRNFVATDGLAQIHTFAGGVDNPRDHWDNLGFDQISKFSHGHHARAGGGADTFNFENIANVADTIVGRLEDFDPTRDEIRIEGELLDLHDLPAHVRVVAFNGAHNDAGADPQFWLLIATPAGGHIFYALEGARIDMDRNGGANSHTHESHFILEHAVPDFDSLPDTVYVNPTDYVPAGRDPDGGDIINDTDVVASDVTEVIIGTGYGDLIAAGLNDDTVDGQGGNDVIWGGTGADVVHGGQGQDELWGNAGHDRLSGDEGNDVLIGGAGADALDGGAGIDVSSYVSANGAVRVDMSDGAANAGDAAGDVFYSIENIEGSSFEDDLRGDSAANEIHGGRGHDRIMGRGGQDTLIGGSGNDFLNGEGDAALFDTTAAKIFRLYTATLNRDPDAAGLYGWADRVMEGTISLEQAAGSFVKSQEFQSRYGDVDNGDFVTLLYDNVLDRAPDSNGLQGWTARLDQGDMTRAEVVLGFSESAEFQAHTATGAQSYSRAAFQADWSDDVFRLYAAVLDRQPDEAGLDSWTMALAEGRSFLSVVSSFVKAREFQDKYGDVTDSEFVELLYANVLGRAPDQSGLNGWTQQLVTGAMTDAEVVSSFVQGNEFRNKSAQPFESWMREKGGDRLDGGAGDNILFGGIGADTFVFDMAGAGTQTVCDMEAWDTVEIANSLYTDTAAAMADLAQQGRDVVLASDEATLVFQGMSLSDFDADMFVLTQDILA